MSWKKVQEMHHQHISWAQVYFFCSCFILFYFFTTDFLLVDYGLQVQVQQPPSWMATQTMTKRQVRDAVSSPWYNGERKRRVAGSEEMTTGLETHLKPQVCFLKFITFIVQVGKKMISIKFLVFLITWNSYSSYFMLVVLSELLKTTSSYGIFLFFTLSHW